MTRRTLLFLLTLPALIGIACAQAEQDWPDFLGPKRSGRSPLAPIETNWPLPIIWQCELGVSYSAPSVLGDRLVHYDRYDDEVRLICRNADTGKTMWAKSHPTAYTDMLGYNNGPRCTPVVAGELVYTMSAEGLLQCRKLETGQLVWQRDTQKEFGVVKNFFGVGSTPLVVGDLLIANIGGSPPGQAGDVYAAAGNVPGNGTGVVAFDRNTGKTRWQTSDELASYASPVTMKLDDRILVLVFARGGLVGVESQTGKVVFKKPWRANLLESVNASTPVVVGNKVFLSETYQLGGILLKARSDEIETVWSDMDRRRDKAMQLHWNTAVYHDGHLYGSSGRHSGSAELRCVEFETGKVRWQERGLGRCSVTYVDNHLVCLSEDGVVRLVEANASGYKKVAQMDLLEDDGASMLTQPAWVAPVIARGNLYVRGADRMICLRLQKASE